MKFFILIAFSLCTFQVHGQSNVPRGLTETDKKEIELEISRQATIFKKNAKPITRWADKSVETEFMVDTFKIRLRNDLYQDINPTTMGINEAIGDMTKRYDLLLNKYYNLLIALLDSEDKKVLQTAQRKWLGFRDAELELIGITKKDKYSGGGTMQSNIQNAEYCGLVESRMMALFSYYNTIYHIKTNE